MWQTRRAALEPDVSGGPGSGLYVSRDGGDSWKRLEDKGLPDGIVGQGRRAGRAERPEPRVRAHRGGKRRALPLRRRRRDLDPGQRLTRNPPARLVLHDADRRPARRGHGLVPAGLDAQDHRRRPQRARRSRGAAGTTTTSGSTRPTRARIIVAQRRRRVAVAGRRRDLVPPADAAIAQFYHLSVDTRTPYRVLGSLQDLGTVSGPSNSLHGGGILRLRLALGRRRRGGIRGRRPERSRHRVGGRVPRLHLPLGRPNRPGAARGDLPRRRLAATGRPTSGIASSGPPRS